MSSMWIAIIILLMVIGCFISGKVSLSITGSLVLVSLLIFNVLPPERVFAGFTNTSVVLFAAMFVVGAVIQKTSILTATTKYIGRFKDKPQILILITSIIATLLSICTSGTIATVILLPILIGICDETGFPRSKILWPLATIAWFSAGAWFLGTGALNMSWSSVMMNLGAKSALNINDFLFIRLPFIIVMILYLTFIAPKLLPNIENTKLSESHTKDSSQAQALTPVKNKIAITIILATIILMILSTYIHIQAYVIAMVGALLLVISGTLTNQEALKAINLNIIFLVASMLSLADALSYTGAGKMIGNLLAKSIGGISNPFLIMGIFFCVSFIVAQFIGSLPTVTIFIPLITLACLKMGLDPRGAVLAVTCSAGAGFLTPIGSAMHAYVMEPGGYSLKDYIKAGWPLAVILIIMGAIVPQLMYPL
ncbi:hypothetical protein FC52_GL001539 [Lactobacillus pasteurii DSM 23907 = CRBIP 24.76]|uniref:Citrate transporter-like domain-containing protein n=1 Tax=Lactobacillus pasteurii DSM 23907 = CRBIP 24.76 TaxID=1423790 RepID=I7JXD2_9LACO|nr:SLC13 family permease [Lactobacillus pasteurii]KRK07841.1 hypothetical protein FC52_GL001539 [Lactobacillus pasteurii DSM 23907 = CRBIP 24.76]TDG77436.1 hypothetical protein C5L33_000879 [Lactobacillus pasteurii]CCI84510.1 G5HYV5 (Putative uncharacterized protein) [Lactobacillus pasteurii DSM 23907 = CRBIP 24.76]